MARAIAAAIRNKNTILSDQTLACPIVETLLWTCNRQHAARRSRGQQEGPAAEGPHQGQARQHLFPPGKGGDSANTAPSRQLREVHLRCSGNFLTTSSGRLSSRTPPPSVALPGLGRGQSERPDRQIACFAEPIKNPTYDALPPIAAPALTPTGASPSRATRPHRPTGQSGR